MTSRIINALRPFLGASRRTTTSSLIHHHHHQLGLLPTTRTFHFTIPLSLKETADRTPQEAEKAKQEQLREQDKGEGRWREDLASEGESNVAADREEVEDHEGHIEQLKREGGKKAEKESV